MNKIKMFLTASAIAFAVAAAFITNAESNGFALILGYDSSLDNCFTASSTQQANCSVNNNGAQCTVLLSGQAYPAYYSPNGLVICNAPLRRP